MLREKRELRTGGQGHPTPIHTSTRTPAHKHLDRLFFHFSTRTDRRTNRPMDGLTDGWTMPLIDSMTEIASSMHNHYLGQFEVHMDFDNLIPHFWEKYEKCGKMKKD